MEKSADSQHSTAAFCFDSSHSFENNQGLGQSTPIYGKPSRKRKATHVDFYPTPPSRPQFSSTLNESLMENMQKCHLQNDSAFSEFSTKGEYDLL